MLLNGTYAFDTHTVQRFYDQQIAGPGLCVMCNAISLVRHVKLNISYS